jgi:hypothetical protein
MRSVMLEVVRIVAEDAPQVGLAEDEDMVETLAPDAAEEPLAGRVLARCSVRSSAMPLAAATRAKAGPYLRSLSRIRNRGHAPNGVASRSC